MKTPPMARGKRKPPKTSKRLSRWWSAKDRAAKWAAIFAMVQVCAAGGMIVGVGIGLAHLDARVHAAPRFHQPPVIELVEVPDGLRDIVMAKLAPLQAAGFEPGICAKIGRALEADPWVRRVKGVRRTHDLRIVARCEYRLPAAFVQIDSDFYLVDKQQVRLPGVYGYQESLPLIQGVEGTAPPPGAVWEAADLAAGMRLARLIAPEPFAPQITAIQVHNYGGRCSPRDTHIMLTTDRAGSVIKWGSAPGEEIEENSARRKTAILRDNFERFGRADADLRAIDISVYPDRFTAAG